MTTLLLTTKFNLPPIDKDFLPRPRLTQKLSTCLHPGNRLALVCAPAGYGKTSLVSEWLHQVEQMLPSIRYAWLTLDQGDDDLARFLNYLVGALRRIDPHLGGGLLTAIQSFRPSSVQLLATLLINDLVKISNPFILVIDDYQQISSKSIHAFLEFMIEHQPLEMKLIMISRSDPPFPLARMRARGQLVELRQKELSFNLAETTNYLVDRVGLGLNSEQLVILEQRTEGWVAGLKLAGLSLYKLPSPDNFVESFSGSQEYIADYLTDEVLATQSEPLKTFLLQTSILDRLSASLCDAVTNQNNSQELLEMLRESNLFVIALDHQGEWYRYHALFYDLLRKRFYQSRASLAGELHMRASRWYRDHGFRHSSIEHALLGQDYEAVFELIEGIGEMILMHGEAVTLLRWLDAIPGDNKIANPILLVYEGLASLMVGKSPNDVRERLRAAGTLGTTDNIQAEINTFEATLAVMRGETQAAIQFAEKALSQLSIERAFLRCLAADNLGMAYTLQGDINAATLAFEKMVGISQKTGNTMMTLMGLSNLAGMRFQQGKLHASAAAYQQVLDLARQEFGGSSPTMGKALLGLGEIHREWNNLDEALRYFSDALGMLEKFVEIGISIAYLSIAKVKSILGDWKSAYENLEKAQQFARQSTTTLLDDQLVELLEVRFWISEGEIDRAQEWANRKALISSSNVEQVPLVDRGTRISEFQLAEQLTLVRLLLAKMQPDQALAVLDPLLAIASHNGAMRRVIEIRVLRSLAFNQMEEIDSALDELRRALSIAEPEGFQRTFLDEGDGIVQLLYRLLNGGFAPDYVGKLLAAFPGLVVTSDSSKQGMDSSGDLIETLSVRELEVLKLISEGLSNQEIAHRLHISLSTVKGHTSQIYGKLAVNNRTHAVAKARSLNLLSPD